MAEHILATSHGKMSVLEKAGTIGIAAPHCGQKLLLGVQMLKAHFTNSFTVRYDPRSRDIPLSFH